MKRINLTLVVFFSLLLVNYATACSFTISHTETQPTCGNNGAFNITTVPAITGTFEIKQGNSQVGFKNGASVFNTSQSYGPGVYKIIVKDLTSGCIDSVDNIVLSSSSSIINVTPVYTKASCKNSADGKIVLVGTVGGFGYQWSHSVLETDSVGDNLAAGDYKVTLTYSGCTVTQSFKLTSVDSISLTSNVVPSNCGKTDGKIELNITGGNPAYTLVWSNGGNKDTLTGLSDGPYTVTITDSKSCPPTVKSYTVAKNPGPKISVKTDTICPGESNGILSAALSQGSSVGMNYFWSHDATLNQKTVDGLQPGQYTVTVEDAGGCRDSATAFIKEEKLKEVFLEGEKTHVVGAQNHFLTATPKEDFTKFRFSPDTFLTNFNSNRILIFPNKNTTFLVEAFYADGCIAKKTIDITISQPAFVLTVPNVFTPNGNGRNDLYSLYELNKDKLGFESLNTFEIHIFDRWGNEVYHSFKIEEGWNGTSESTDKASSNRDNMNGVYGYIIKYTLKNKTDRLVLSGNITMVK